MVPSIFNQQTQNNNNLTKYIDTIAPTHYDGGGGFAISQFTLNGLYELFIKAQNWWTQSNCYLPLIRYFGCQLTFYRSENYDYVAHVHRCLPLKATDELYMSSQPYIMLLSKKCIRIHCKKNSKSKKPFKKVFVKPPTQYTNKWMFQADMCNQPLLIVQTAACSFDRMYLASDWQSTTVGFISLNTQSFILHNWNKPPTTGFPHINSVVLNFCRPSMFFTGIPVFIDDVVPRYIKFVTGSLLGSCCPFCVPYKYCLSCG